MTPLRLDDLRRRALAMRLTADGLRAYVERETAFLRVCAALADTMDRGPDASPLADTIPAPPPEPTR